MVFGFGAIPVVGQDPSGVDLGAAYARLSQPGGYPVDLATIPQAAAPQPAPVQSAPPAAPPQQSFDIKVSPWETALSMLANGGTPGEAAQSVRATKLKNLMDAYQLQQAQIRMQALSGATPQQQQAMLFNPAEYGKSVAANFAPIQTAEGASQTMFGGSTQPGGYSTIAPQLMLGPAGQPLALTQNGAVSLGPQLAGKKTATNGVVMDENLGPVGNYSTPQAVAGRLLPFTAGVNYRPPQSASIGPLEAMVRAAGLAAPGTTTTPVQANGNAQGAPPLDGAAFFRSFVMPHEGGLNPHDMNGLATNYGINQAANPGVNVSKLTPAQAEDIFVKKYWWPSGAASLPAALAGVHADTYFINPKMAQSFLRQSGGDPNAYLGLREAWMQNMLQNNPRAAPYAKAWTQRNADLQQFINANGGAGQASGQAAQPGIGTQQVGPDGTLHFQGGIGTPAGATGQPLTTAAERQAAGIPPNDTRPYIRGEDGLPKLIAPEYGPEQKATLRNQVLSSDEYKQANAAMTAYSAMISNAKTMTGPAAYAMLDTFARAINPGAVARPQVIETIEKNLGLPAQLVGRLDSAFGKGNLPPQVRQQIIDAVVPFAQAHWDQANHLNSANADLAKAHGFDAADVTAPLGARPQGVSIAALEAGIPAPPQRKIGQVYPTPKGPMTWQADGWHPAGGR